VLPTLTFDLKIPSELLTVVVEVIAAAELTLAPLMLAEASVTVPPRSKVPPDMNSPEFIVNPLPNANAVLTLVNPVARTVPPRVANPPTFRAPPTIVLTAVCDQVNPTGVTNVE
jgi:hypothetical protein